jgi:Major intrinsic protein
MLITILGPISGAYFNPAVSLVFALKRDLRPQETGLYMLAQVIGGIVGTFAAHLMLGLPMPETSLKVRTGGAQWFAEWVATFGRRHHPRGPSFCAAVRALARWALHHGRLLVHRLDLFRQSGRRDRVLLDQHLFRHQAR